jgi:hypothetical protein
MHRHRNGHCMLLSFSPLSVASSSDTKMPLALQASNPWKGLTPMAAVYRIGEVSSCIRPTHGTADVSAHFICAFFFPFSELFDSRHSAHTLSAGPRLRALVSDSRQGKAAQRHRPAQPRVVQFAGRHVRRAAAHTHDCPHPYSQSYCRWQRCGLDTGRGQQCKCKCKQWQWQQRAGRREGCAGQKGPGPRRRPACAAAIGRGGPAHPHSQITATLAFACLFGPVTFAFALIDSLFLCSFPSPPFLHSRSFD